MDISSRKITVDDVVSMAGVTKSAVSGHFNRSNVKGSARGRTQKIIREHSYELDTSARLEIKESNVIGVVLPTPNSKASSRVVASIGRYLRKQGYEALTKGSDHSMDLELKSVQRLIALKVDDIILNAITITEAHGDLIQESPVPVAVTTQEYDEGVSIVYDDYGTGKVMGVRVGRAASVQVGYMGVSGPDVAVGFNRRQGVMDGLKEYDVKSVVTATGDYGYASGIRMAEEVLDQGPVDTIICTMGHLAFDAYHILGERGLRIPEDVFVAGFGGCGESTLLKPELTTLCFDSYGLGHLGAETILRMIRREPVSEKQVVDYRIIEGGSAKK